MIAVDWGSSSLRVFRLDAQGVVIDSRHSAHGVAAAGGEFENVLRRQIDGWDDALILMCGMVGSRQGWQEVPYVQCPAGVEQIVAGLAQLQAHGMGSRQLWIAPGLSLRRAEGAFEVMRGEETQLCGLLEDASTGVDFACLAGTHSKHVRIDGDLIVDFSTFMTGELFELLRTHSVLGKLMRPGPHHEVVFRRGVDMAARKQELLTQLFAVRTQGLLGDVNPSWLESYLSGILIGHELNAVPEEVKTVHLVASESLLPPYRAALHRRGLACIGHAESLAAKGLHALALRRGLLA